MPARRTTMIVPTRNISAANATTSAALGSAAPTRAPTNAETIDVLPKILFVLAMLAGMLGRDHLSLMLARPRHV